MFRPIKKVAIIASILLLCGCTASWSIIQPAEGTTGITSPYTFKFGVNPGSCADIVSYSAFLEKDGRRDEIIFVKKDTLYQFGGGTEASFYYFKRLSLARGNYALRVIIHESSGGTHCSYKAWLSEQTRSFQVGVN